MTTQKLRFIRKREVMHLTGLSSSAIYDLMSRNLFPQKITLAGGKAVAWIESDVEKWMYKVIESNVPNWYIELCNVLLEVRHATTKHCLSNKTSKVIGFTKALSALNIINHNEHKLIEQILRNACFYANLEISNLENQFNSDFQNGIDAYLNGKNKSENPHPVDSKAYGLWKSGYKYARLLPS